MPHLPSGSGSVDVRYRFLRRLVIINWHAYIHKRLDLPDIAHTLSTQLQHVFKLKFAPVCINLGGARLVLVIISVHEINNHKRACVYQSTYI